jgi:hypothetical protein
VNAGHEDKVLAAHHRVCIVVALLSALPLWVVRYPPIVDLPFHLSTLRIIHDFHSPAFRFDQDMVLTLGRTQYVAFYLLGSLLAYVVGVPIAGKILVSAYLTGTVLALRALAVALGRDARLCLFAVPFLVNALLVLGLLPFLLGVPVCLYGLAVAARHFETPDPRRGLLLGAVAVLLFTLHVFPFFLLCLGAVAMFPWGARAKWRASAWPLAPAVAVVVAWLAVTEAGHLVLGSVVDPSKDPRLSFVEKIADAHNWLNDVYVDPSDNLLLVFTLALLVPAGLSAVRHPPPARARLYWVLPFACVVLYFAGAQGHGTIWLIAQRFPILFVFTGIPVLHFPERHGRAYTVALAAVGLLSIGNHCRHFRAFEREVGNIDGAIAQMEPRKRVCALVFLTGSPILKPMFAPFVHFGNYYQLEKGGVVMFTYVGFPHWPVDFIPGHGPPGQERPRWEWLPHSVPLSEVYPYFDYVLTRGPGWPRAGGKYAPTWNDGQWTVWAKVD